LTELKESEKEAPGKDKNIETRQLFLIEIKLLFHKVKEIEVKREENSEH